MGRLVTRLVLVGLFAAAMAVGLWLVRPGGEGTDLAGGPAARPQTSGSASGEPAPLPTLPGAPSEGASRGATGGTDASEPTATRPGAATPAGESGEAQVRLAGIVRDTEGRPAEGAVLSVRSTAVRRATRENQSTGLLTVAREVVLLIGADGRFDLSTAARVSDEDGADESVKVEATGGGFTLVPDVLTLLLRTSENLVLEVRRLPAIRVQILDAGTRAAVGPLVGIEACQARLDGEWWSLWADPGAREIVVMAPGYVSARPVLQFPDTGTVTRGEPILLEPGRLVWGIPMSAGGAAMADVLVVAERTGGPPSTVSGFALATRGGAGGYEIVLPVGAYRLLAFAKGHAPWTADVSVQGAEQRVDPVLRPFGTEGPPAALPFRWADRRHVAIPMETADLPGAEIVAWIEAIVGAPIAVEPDARAVLAALDVNASFTGVPAEDALTLVAALANLEFDKARGALRVPR